MNRDLTNAELEFIIGRIIKNAEDVLEEEKNEKDDFIDGKKLAYFEVLDSIKNELSVRDVDTEELGIDRMISRLM